jgi:hypothetical protein
MTYWVPSIVIVIVSGPVEAVRRLTHEVDRPGGAGLARAREGELHARIRAHSVVQLSETGGVVMLQAVGRRRGRGVRLTLRRAGAHGERAAARRRGAGGHTRDRRTAVRRS